MGGATSPAATSAYRTEEFLPNLSPDGPVTHVVDSASLADCHGSDTAPISGLACVMTMGSGPASGSKTPTPDRLASHREGKKRSNPPISSSGTVSLPLFPLVVGGKPKQAESASVFEVPPGDRKRKPANLLAWFRNPRRLSCAPNGHRGSEPTVPPERHHHRHQ